MLQSEPDDVFLNYALAKAFVEEGRVDEGLAQFRRTLQLDPDHVASYFQLAQVLAAEGDEDEARSVVAQGIAVARQVGDTHAEMEMTGFLETL
jgi:thioredoxin-like negative regulator of GroEL